MKIGDIIDLDVPGNKEQVQTLIDEQGIAKDINQIATTIICRDLNGVTFELVQFWSSRRFIRVCSHQKS